MNLESYLLKRLTSIIKICVTCPNVCVVSQILSSIVKYSQCFDSELRHFFLFSLICFPFEGV